MRRDSDVDVGVLCYDTFFYEIPDDNVKAQLQKSITPATYEYATFKRELGEALVAYFGEASVTKGNKAFDIKANTYRVEADVAPFFEHRRYTSAYDYHSGVEMIPDDLNPPRIKNWPEQHYDNGVMKNTNAARRYKRMVRVLKSLSNEMSRGGAFSLLKMCRVFWLNAFVGILPTICFACPDTTKLYVRRSFICSKLRSQTHLAPNGVR